MTQNGIDRDNRDNNTFGVREEELDLRRYLYAIFRKKWILFSFITVALVINLINASKKVPTYRATALILIEQPSPRFSLRSSREEIQPQMRGNDYYSTQYQLLKSEMMAKRVSDALDLKSAFGCRNPENRLRRIISIEPVSKTQLVKISVVYTDPVLAAKIANTLIDFFMKQNLERMFHMSQEVLEFIPEEDVKKIERHTVAGDLKSLSREEAIESLPSIAGDPVLRSLKAEKDTIENELFGLSQRYKEKHPTIVALKRRLEYVNEKIPLERERILNSIRTDLLGVFRINNIRIIDYAKPPKYPMGTNTKQDIIYSIFFSTFLGLGVIFLTEYLDDTIKNQQDIENKLNLPYLGEFPLLDGDMAVSATAGDSGSKHAYNEFIKLEKSHEIFEAIRNIRTNIIFSAPKESLKNILITSAIPQEGKSFLASYLAFAFAKNGVKTLIIDADVRKPNMHRLFNFERSPGLTNILAEGMLAEDVIKKTNFENLWVLTSGSKTPSPLELMGSLKMKALVKEFSSKFEKIIIDTPPSLLLSDALVLSKISDATILVAKSGGVSKEAINKIKERFTPDGKILGVILNFFEVKKHSYYYKYRYYHKYYKNYYTSNGKRQNGSTRRKNKA
ncbi:MAG: polysaccharide biosynthesis tyrosine autokinase [Candidatus Omnitrophota bacterium]